MVYNTLILAASKPNRKRYTQDNLYLYFFIFIQGNDDFTLKSANELYVDKTCPQTEEFQSALKENVGAPAQNINFKTACDNARMTWSPILNSDPFT